MGFCKSDQKSIPVVGFLTHNDCDVLRAKTGLYRRVTHRTIILPTPEDDAEVEGFAWRSSEPHTLGESEGQCKRRHVQEALFHELY